MLNVNNKIKMTAIILLKFKSSLGLNFRTFSFFFSTKINATAYTPDSIEIVINSEV